MTALTAKARMLVTRAKTARAKADRATLVYAAVQRRAALALTELGITRRDAGDLLGVSHQRVQQLLEERP